MHVKMRNGLAGIGPVVDDEAEAAREPEFLGDDPRGHQQMSEHGFIGRGRFADPGDELLGNDEEMNRRLWLDIVQDDATIILMLDLRWNLTVDDLLKNRLGHDAAELTTKNTEYTKKIP